MGFMDAVYDSFKGSYPVQLIVWTDLGTSYHLDKAKIKNEEGGVFWKLFNHKNYVPYTDLSTGIMYHGGKIEYEVYMPTDKELIPVDRRRVKITEQLIALRRAKDANDADGLNKAIVDLEKFASKPVFMDSIVPAGVRMGLVQQVRLEVNYFGKTWLEKYGNIVLTAIFVIGTVAIVWLALDFVNNAVPKIAAQIPNVVSAYVDAASKIPKV